MRMTSTGRRNRVCSILRPIATPVTTWFKHFTISNALVASALNLIHGYYLWRYKPVDSRYFRWLYCLELTRELPGDIVELGVGPGRFMAYCGSWLNATRSARRYWGYDTFAGFPEVSEEDKNGLSEDRLRLVKPGHYGQFPRRRIEHLARHMGLRNVRLVEGDFRHTLKTTRPEQVSFLYMDCDLYESYKVGLELLYHRVVPGGIILFDEYDRTNEWPGAKKAVDEFFADRLEKPQQLPFSPSYYVERQPSESG